LRKIYVVFSKLYTIPGLASVSSERTISPRFDACRRGPPKGTAKNGGKANWVPSHNTANPQPQQDLTPPRAKVFCHLDGLWVHQCSLPFLSFSLQLTTLYSVVAAFDSPHAITLSHTYPSSPRSSRPFLVDTHFFCSRKAMGLVVNQHLLLQSQRPNIEQEDLMRSRSTIKKRVILIPPSVSSCALSDSEWRFTTGVRPSGGRWQWHLLPLEWRESTERRGFFYLSLALLAPSFHFPPSLPFLSSPLHGPRGASGPGLRRGRGRGCRARRRGVGGRHLRPQGRRGERPAPDPDVRLHPLPKERPRGARRFLARLHPSFLPSFGAWRPSPLPGNAG
jgi:hypothetical protein